MRHLVTTLLLAGLFALGSVGAAFAACDFHTAKTDERVATGPSAPIVVPDDEGAGG